VPLAHTAVGILPARDVEAVKTVAFVFVLMVVTIEEEAALISDNVAKEPESREAPVSVRVVFDQISETNVPTEVSVLLALDQIDVARVVVDTTVSPTVNVLSNLTRSPDGTLPQDI
jgi:hypothetical protein